jgi:hypothetical protein
MTASFCKLLTYQKKGICEREREKIKISENNFLKKNFAKKNSEKNIWEKI